MPEETPNAEQPVEDTSPTGEAASEGTSPPTAEQPAGAVPDNGGGNSGGNPAPSTAPAPAGEGQPGGTAGGGEGGESQPESQPAEEGGSEVSESAGETTPPVEEAPAPEAPVVPPAPAVPPPQPATPPMSSDDPEKRTVLGNGPTPPSSSEPPTAGLPTGEDETDDEEEDVDVVDELVELGNDALDKAKEIGRATLKEALTESRDFISTVLNNKSMTEAEKQEVARLYRAAEKHALNGKVAVSHAMGKRLDNFVKSSGKVHKSQKARASQNYLTGLLRLATGAVSTFFGAFGQPLVDKLTDIGLKATDEFLQ